MLGAIRRFYNKLLGSAAFMQLVVLACAGPVFTVLVTWIVYLINAARWAPAHQALQLGIMRDVAFGLLFLLGIVLVAMTAGLIRGVKFTLPGGTSAEINLDEDDETTQVQVETQTQVSVRPAANTETT